MLAPAILPRSWLNQQILLAIQEVCRYYKSSSGCALMSLHHADLRCLHSVGPESRSGLDRQVQGAEACQWAVESIYLLISIRSCSSGEQSRVCSSLHVSTEQHDVQQRVQSTACRL